MTDLITMIDYIVDNFLPIAWSIVISNWIMTLLLLFAIVTAIVSMVRNRS